MKKCIRLVQYIDLILMFSCGLNQRRLRREHKKHTFPTRVTIGVMVLNLNDSSISKKDWPTWHFHTCQNVLDQCVLSQPQFCWEDLGCIHHNWQILDGERLRPWRKEWAGCFVICSWHSGISEGMSFWTWSGMLKDMMAPSINLCISTCSLNPCNEMFEKTLIQLAEDIRCDRAVDVNKRDIFPRNALNRFQFLH